MKSDWDLDSCTLELAEGPPLTMVTGLSVGLAPAADGVTVYLRCTVTIAEETWGPTVHLVKIPAKPRIAPAPLEYADPRGGVSSP